MKILKTIIVYVLLDVVMHLANEHNYMSLYEMWNEWYQYQQKVFDILADKRVLWQLVPLSLTYFVLRII